MPKYQMTLTETYAVNFEIEADNQQHAYELANEKYWAGNVAAAAANPKGKFIDGSITDCDEVS